MSRRLQDQILALAGVAQFALHAHELASAGRDASERVRVARRAIFSTDPDSVIDVYGDLADISTGMDYLERQFGGFRSNTEAALVARYMGQLLRLAARLQKNSTAGDRIRGAIDRARLVEASEAERILAEGYQAAISPMKPRIMLRGHPSYLENPVIQARARTLLLAGIRCGYMWRQRGGSFPALLLRRKALLQALRTVRADADAA